MVMAFQQQHRGQIGQQADQGHDEHDAELYKSYAVGTDSRQSARVRRSRTMCTATSTRTL